MREVRAATAASTTAGAAPTAARHSRDAATVPGVQVTLPEPELHYVLDVLPPGRFPFRRWRWELWHGPRLLATGWRTTERHAEHALRTAASRFAHRVLGVHALRPEANAVPGGFRAGAPVRVDCGAVTCLLLPRSAQADAA